MSASTLATLTALSAVAAVSFASVLELLVPNVSWLSVGALLTVTILSLAMLLTFILSGVLVNHRE